MIKDFDISKALVDYVKANISGFDIVETGESYSPSPETEYIQEAVILGDEFSLGVNGSSSDKVNGTYQLKVATKISRQRWYHANKCDEVKALFAKYGIVSNNAQEVRFLNTSKSPATSDETHLISYLRFRFYVIG